MYVCDKTKIVFCPIERTASTTIQEVLENELGCEFRTIGSRHRVPDEIDHSWKSYRIISSCRHPYTRMISLWQRSLEEARHLYDGQFETYFDIMKVGLVNGEPGWMTKEVAVRYGFKNGYEAKDKCYCNGVVFPIKRTQTNYFDRYSTLFGRPYDIIIKFESLKSDLSNLVGRDFELPHRRITNNTKLIDEGPIRDFFIADYLLWGYS